MNNNHINNNKSVFDFDMNYHYYQSDIFNPYKIFYGGYTPKQVLKLANFIHSLAIAKSQMPDDTDIELQETINELYGICSKIRLDLMKLKSNKNYIFEDEPYHNNGKYGRLYNLDKDEYQFHWNILCMFSNAKWLGYFITSEFEDQNSKNFDMDNLINAYDVARKLEGLLYWKKINEGLVILRDN